MTGTTLLKFIKANNIQDKLKAIKSIETSCPEGIHYSDLMLNSTDSSLEKYDIYNGFNDSSEAIVYGGISPEGNLNIYGDSNSSMKDMANFLLKTSSQPIPFIRSSLKAQDLATYNPELKTKLIRSNKVIGLKYETQSTSIADYKLDIKIATNSNEDREHIQNWYNAFNLEMNDNHCVPSKEYIESRKMILLFDEKKNLIGGCAQNIPNDKRFWIGRFFIFQQFRKKGIAEKFHNIIANLAHQEKKDIYLFVHEDNIRAQKFYKKVGYKSAGDCFYAKYKL
jgi:RimJ/RimL family protein N-acetyltransferase